MQNVQSVYFNAGGKDVNQFALVIATRDDGNLDLLAFDKNGSGGLKGDIPRREPIDYGPEGGGDTWHTNFVTEEALAEFKEAAKAAAKRPVSGRTDVNSR